MGRYNWMNNNKDADFTLEMVFVMCVLALFLTVENVDICRNLSMFYFINFNVLDIFWHATFINHNICFILKHFACHLTLKPKKKL